MSIRAINRLQRPVGQGDQSISRREFLRFAGLFGASVPVAYALAACGVPAKDNDPLVNYDPYSRAVVEISEAVAAQNYNPLALPVVRNQFQPDQTLSMDLDGDDRLIALGDGPDDAYMLLPDEQTVFDDALKAIDRNSSGGAFMMGMIVPRNYIGRQLVYHTHLRNGQEKENCPEKLGHDWRLTLLILGALVGLKEVTRTGMSAEIAAIGEHLWYNVPWVDVVARVPLANLQNGLNSMGTNLEQMGLSNLANITPGLLEKGKNLLMIFRFPDSQGTVSSDGLCCYHRLYFSTGKRFHRGNPRKCQWNEKCGR